ncbi:MAG: MBL fold metallo-hydrolase [Kiritimatiellae bacterium]|nr:MBL fold metallo-hydrolase [Kiritimatiellia bacterium]
MREPGEARITVLGSGTSTGVPVVGCSCPVCLSRDPRDRRSRCGIHVACEGFGLQIDVSPDFREQALRHRFGRVDAVVVTHCHADHVLGLDDLRRFNTIQGTQISLHAAPATMRGIERIFGYLVKPPPEQAGMYRAKIDFRETGDEPFECGPFLVRLFDVPHGPAHASAVEVRAGSRRLVAATDCSEIPPALADAMRGADVVLLDGLRHRPHAAHLTVERASEALLASGCKRPFLIHLGHDIPHARLLAELPPPVRPAFDGLVLPL